MSQNTPESVSKDDVISQIQVKQTELERQVKGIKGQLGLVRKEAGLGRPQATEKVEPAKLLSQEQASETPKEATKEATAPEFLRPYEKFCPDCGGPNPSYVKPNLFCRDCGVPQATVKDTTEESLSKIKLCWNCGGVNSKIVN